MYKPYIIFATLGTSLLVAGIIPFIRYIYLVSVDSQGDHIQSLLVGAVLVVGALIAFALGIISDIIRTNRILLEDTLERTKQIQFARNHNEKK